MTTDAARRDRRNTILAAAIDVFAEKGFHHSRVSDIARKAGVADGTIYLYFKSKDDILITIFEERMEVLLREARRAVDDVSDPLAKLTAFAEFHMGQVEEHRALASVLQVELRLSNKFMREYHPVRLREYLDIIGDIVREGQVKGVIRKDCNPIVVRRALFGALDEIAMQWTLTPHPRYRLVSTAREVSDIFIRGLRA
jgi:TetR/AcrR family transcriptional regulator, fatty acid metabolism regulator protein